MSGNRKEITTHKVTREVLSEWVAIEKPLGSGIYEKIGDQLRERWPETLQPDFRTGRQNIPFIRLLNISRAKGMVKLKYGKYEVVNG
uniref:Uncharacterized protein n=1 Tax=viral metagenome TaxID=1070528 RepID=A0A6M3LVV3_9ZZZZ